MTQQEYEQKKRECWEECAAKVAVETTNLLCKAIAYSAFDRAYALGREKETITQEEIESNAIEYVKDVNNDRLSAYPEAMRPQLYPEYDMDDLVNAFVDGAHFALGKQEKDAEETKADVTMKARRKSDGKIIEVKEWRGASDVVYSEPDMNRLYQASDLEFNVDAEDTVIQGWVLVDEETFQRIVRVHKITRGDYEAVWDSGEPEFYLEEEVFPDMTPNDRPEPVEIIIKRKKKNL